jgi:Raf kinase inhibitor-like YbhB/YbcL family protein
LAALLLTCAGVARAEPNITGVYSPITSGPDGQPLTRAPAPFTPAARAAQAAIAKLNAANHRIISENRTKCLPTGMPTMMTTPFGIEFLQTKGRVTVISELNNLPRTIYLDEKTQPDDIVPGWNGHSIGHWEGDTLLVDTVGFNGRNPNTSTKMHMSERIYKDKDGDLVDELTMDDPNIYTQPYTITTRYKRAVGQEASELQEYVCEIDPNNLFAYEAEQKAAGRPSDFNPGWAAVNYNNPASVAAAEAGGPPPAAKAAPPGAPTGPAGPSKAPRKFLTLTSTAFDDSAVIPPKYDGVETGVSPPLSWINTPAGTQSFTLLLHDMEPAPGHNTPDITHWLMFNIPATATSVPENVKPGAQLPDGTIQAKNVRGLPAYMGPEAPPPLYHHYVFELYALDTKLSLGPDATRAQIMAAMDGHVLGKAVLVGRQHS